MDVQQRAERAAIAPAQLKRIAQLRRAFQRELGRMPTTLQKTLIDAAAVLQARAEACAIDTTTTINQVVRIQNLARRARLDMLASFTLDDSERDPTYDELIAEHGGAL
jgi:hypothetical protein